MSLNEKPFVKFVWEVNRQEAASAKLSFRRGTSIYINKLHVDGSYIFIL